MLKIALTGARGYIGSLLQLYNKDKYEFIPITSNDLDLTHPEKVYDYFNALNFDIVVHMAANPTTADCENFPMETHNINAASAIEIAKVCKDKNKKFVFISTEQVFNGKKVKGPFKESDEVACVTNYGLHKIEVEEWVENNLTDYIILRLSSQIGMALPHICPSSNFIKQTLNAMISKKPTLFTVNENRGITYVQRFVDQFDKILTLPSDLYHFSSYNDKNTYEVAKYIAKSFGYEEERIASYILPNTERYKDRFRDYRMNCDKIKSFGIELGTMEEDINLCLHDFGWK